MKLLTLDSRNRVSLGDLAKHDYYIPVVEDDGTIVLIPAKVVSKNEQLAETKI